MGNQQKAGQSEQRPVKCPYCHKAAMLVTGEDIYAHRPDLRELSFWRCAPCKAYVGCHKAGFGQGDGTRPLGRLANAELRKARNAAHAAFDPMWKTGEIKRLKAYRWLADQLGIAVAKTHIADFGMDMCQRVVMVCRRQQSLKK